MQPSFSYFTRSRVGNQARLSSDGSNWIQLVLVHTQPHLERDVAVAVDVHLAQRVEDLLLIFVDMAVAIDVNVLGQLLLFFWFFWFFFARREGTYTSIGGGGVVGRGERKGEGWMGEGEKGERFFWGFCGFRGISRGFFLLHRLFFVGVCVRAGVSAGEAETHGELDGHHALVLRDVDLVKGRHDWRVCYERRLLC